MHDQIQINFTLLLGDPPESFSIGERLLNHYPEIEDGGDVFHTFTAGGSRHTIMDQPAFYTYSAEGVRFADWAAEVANGRDAGDVSCVDDARGCANAPE